MQCNNKIIQQQVAGVTELNKTDGEQGRDLVVHIDQIQITAYLMINLAGGNGDDGGEGVMEPQMPVNYTLLLKDFFYK